MDDGEKTEAAEGHRPLRDEEIRSAHRQEGSEKAGGKGGRKWARGKKGPLNGQNGKGQQIAAHGKARIGSCPLLSCEYWL